ncbi:MAG: hypothetical protein I3273_02310 [Candidatus Moeniiplasma glomeromycotorum]|nr:hypothetical protein [Candidatus Moeniiplasma glomeromycotorum]MCE8167049.1 hypothetical protein [Candidatus Moeniiplasma glomeromycotorum]MCE8168939.1 hypothetical protein [Candidatus Moeniiplasma glomeromycotorum]
MTNWKNISLDFNEQLQKEWENRGFDYSQTHDWINIGLQPQDYNFASYLQNNRGSDVETILNEGNLETLRKEYQEELETQEVISRNIIENETQTLFENFEETQLQEALSKSLLISQTQTEPSRKKEEEDSQLQATLLVSTQEVQIEKLQKEITSLKNQIFYREIVEERHQELEKQIQALTGENNSLKAELKKVRHQNEDLKKQLQSFQSARTELKRNEFTKLVQDIKNKLGDEELVDDFLETYQEVIQSNNSFAQRRLEKIKPKLLKKISEQEIERLCQLQREILEMEVKLEEKVETCYKNIM